MSQTLIEGVHFYHDDNGFIVLTEHYHLSKGYCCGNGCRHCPYLYATVPEPKRTALLEEKARLTTVNQ